MSKHDHPEPKPPCAHESLKFCAKCDAVECTACGNEWKKPGPPLLCFREYADDEHKGPYRARLWPSQPFIAPHIAPQFAPSAQPSLWPGQTFSQTTLSGNKLETNRLHKDHS